MAPRFRLLPGGDVPANIAARRMGMTSEAAFLAALPKSDRSGVS